MMMKWGKQKASTSHHPSLISHVFPSSWLSRFKQSKNSSDQDMLAEEKKKGQLLPSRVSSPGIRVKEGRFYSADDDDSYWRLSFGDEQAEKLEGDDEMPAPVTFPRSSSLGREKSRKSHDMFFNLGQTRIVQSKAGFSLQGSAAALRRKKVRGAAERKRARRSKSVKVQSFEELGPRISEEEEKTTKAAEKVIFEVQPERIAHPVEDFCQKIASNSQTQRNFSFPNSKLTRIGEEFTSEAETQEPEEDKEMSLQAIMRDTKSAETKSKHEQQQRKSVHINREYRRKRRKLAAKIECKIKALEEMKKVKMMKKKKKEREPEPADTTVKRAERNTTKEKALGDIRTLDSYAVIKNSRNPRQDFRESMIEMILEKGIRKPEEFEELLACYLTLNCDECHDLIVKVFREVWLELNELRLAFKSQNECFDDY